MFGGYINGTTLSDLLLTYDLDSHVLRVVTSDSLGPTTRSDHAAVMLHDFMYLMGGKNLEIYYNDIWQYSVSRNTWR